MDLDTADFVRDSIELLIKAREETFRHERLVALYELQTWVHFPDWPAIRRTAVRLVGSRLLAEMEEDYVTVHDASPPYSPKQPAAMSLRIQIRHIYPPPPADLTAFPTVSARRWRLIRRGSIGALTPAFTSGAESARQSIHETVRRRGSWQQTPA